MSMVNIHTFEGTMFFYAVILLTLFGLDQLLAESSDIHIQKGLFVTTIYFVFSLGFSLMDGFYEYHYQTHPNKTLPYLLRKTNDIYKTVLKKENKQFGDKVKQIIPWKKVQQAMLSVFLQFTLSTLMLEINWYCTGIVLSPRLPGQITLIPLILNVIDFWVNLVTNLIAFGDLRLLRELLFMLICILWADVIFWITHFTFHRFRWLYKFHKDHHQYILTHAVFGASTHFMDQILINIPTIVLPSLISSIFVCGHTDVLVHATVFIIFVFGTTVQHCSFAIFDKLLSGVVRKHDYHHKYADCEFGIGVFMDWICKTTFKDIHGEVY